MIDYQGENAGTYMCVVMIFVIVRIHIILLLNVECFTVLQVYDTYNKTE